MPKTVGVAVSNATFHFDKLYTYAVMPDQQDAVRLGSMVLVPFGRGSRARMGVVLACDEEPESSKLKFLFDVAPASACLTPELLRLVHFLKERTFCTYYEAVKAVIPYGAQYKPAVAADGVTPVLQKQLTRHTENSYKLAGTLPAKPKPTAKQLAAVALLGGMIEQVYEYPIQDALHKAVVIRKIRPTPEKYPRAFAKIKKSPL